MVKDLFKCFEILRRSVIVVVGSDEVLIVDLAGLGKKNLIHCQILSSKFFLMQFYKRHLSV